jgi:hypothetical protein
MNKEELQVGDLVTHTAIFIDGVGLVIKKEYKTVGFAQRYMYDVHWFTTAHTGEHSKGALVKCRRPGETKD